MRYVNQLENPHMLYVTRTSQEGADKERGRTTTIKSSGCGLCSAIMVADRLLVNYKFDLDDAIQLSYDTEANHRLGTDYQRFAPAFAEKLGTTRQTVQGKAYTGQTSDYRSENHRYSVPDCKGRCGGGTGTVWIR